MVNNIRPPRASIAVLQNIKKHLFSHLSQSKTIQPIKTNIDVNTLKM